MMAKTLQNPRIRQAKQYANDLRNDLKYSLWRWRAHSDMPVLSPQDRIIVDDLKHTGVHVCSLESLAVPETSALLKAGDAMTDLLAERPVADDDYAVSADKEDLKKFPELIHWGLDERLLSIVTAYIGLPVAYRGLTVRRDLVGGPKSETRMWHRDNEDNRILKIIVYLNDVGEDGGPFEFIPASLTPPSWRVSLVDSSRVTDDGMARLVGVDHWRPCTGSRGTAVFVDTCRVFHRGRVAESEDRRTLFYCYNSRYPMNPQWCQPLFDEAKFISVRPELTPLQRRTIQSVA